ncbi:MAG: hypothetical protein AAGD33_01360 [Actinomycetota bacterium]
MLHVPKSGGNTVLAAIRASLPDDAWAPYHFDPAMFGPFADEPIPEQQRPLTVSDPTELTRFLGASGHYALPTLMAGFAAADVVLLLREPRARLLSHYEYWRGLPDEHLDDGYTWSVTATASELDLTDWIGDPRVAYQTDNIVVRMVLGRHDRVPDTDFIAEDDLLELAHEARAAVATLGHVDVLERGVSMWASLGRRIGRPDLVAPPSENVTGRRGDKPIDPATFDRPEFADRLDRCTRGDAVVWESVARRVGVERPQRLADQTWQRRLGEVTAGDGAADPGPGAHR